MKIILASASPRRKELLEKTGLEFSIDPANINEEKIYEKSARKLVEILAIEKAKEVAKRHPDCIIIGSDTAVVLDDKVLGKPKNKADAKRILQMLRGKTNYVMTGVAVIKTENNKILSRVEIGTVKMKNYTDREIDDYIATGEPMDCAGAFKIQGLGGSGRMVKEFSGDEETIIGLPTKNVMELLEEISK